MESFSVSTANTDKVIQSVYFFFLNEMIVFPIHSRQFVISTLRAKLFFISQLNAVVHLTIVLFLEHHNSNRRIYVAHKQDKICVTLCKNK